MSPSFEGESQNLFVWNNLIVDGTISPSMTKSEIVTFSTKIF
jgi:hypothetical protein